MCERMAKSRSSVSALSFVGSAERFVPVDASSGVLPFIIRCQMPCQRLFSFPSASDCLTRGAAGMDGCTIRHQERICVNSRAYISLNISVLDLIQRLEIEMLPMRIRSEIQHKGNLRYLIGGDSKVLSRSNPMGVANRCI
ncbi:hypothetical protein NPIL_54911 [Nephila pilipes]|uniref:Uncharacterized protein n=1 Tax=Nephila pilipes TaxID=299642 RepID=A0A8X6Q9C4_NEPPI|nr:hypothetical protein NPIL_54911 [Nephila pilipes]